MSFKRSVINTGALIALAGTTGFVQSQQAPAPAQGERVEITGSRIRSINAESSSPIQVISGEEIRATGATNVQDFLLRNPTMGEPTYSRTNSNFLTQSVGVASIDLRDLGPERTLVLINGRRVVAGVPGESTVDLNTIPTQFVERIELLTGGASAAYGSDAVAGVVNIILKKQFTGVQFDAKYGQSERNDDKRAEAGITIGTGSADGKGNIMLHFGVSKQGAVMSSNRDASAVDQISTGALSGDSAEFFVPTRPFFSSFAPQGRIFFGPLTSTGAYSINRTFDAAGNIIPFSTNGNPATGVAPTGFNRTQYRTIAVPTDRALFSSVGSYEFADGHRAFIEGTFAMSKTKSVIEPFPLDSVEIAPNIPAETFVGGVAVANPLIPAALYAQMVDTDGDGLRDYSFTRRLNEVGNRGNRANRDMFRMITGLEGQVFNKNWDYSVYLGYGNSKEAQVGAGQVNVGNMRYALAGVPDSGDVDGDGNTTEVICADPVARSQGCVPISIFGFNSITPAAAAYVNAPSSLSTETRQMLFGGTISGEPFRVPAGPVGMAFGFERRDEYSVNEFDALTQAGLNAGNAQPRTEGSFDVNELFGEVKVPLLRGLPGVKLLSFNGAVRGAKYSTVGSVLSYNTGVEWKANDMFKLRATHALSTRAPNISELYQPPQQTFPTGLSDPCEGVTAATTGALADNCRAAPGVNANIAANGAFTLNQADVQGISGFNRGNPAVTEEKGKSNTIGLAITPTDNVAVTLDYFDIKIDDAIVPTPRQFILDQCYGAGNATFCNFVRRRATAVGANSAGSLDEIDSAVTNSGAYATRGTDLTFAFQQRVGQGRVSTALTWTHLLDGYLIPLPGSEKDYFAGEVGSPKDKLALRLGYDLGPFAVSMLVTYIGKSALDDQFLAGFTDADGNPLPRGSVTVKAKTYTDLSMRYAMNKTFEFYGGIDNLFDTNPAPVISGLPGNDTGTETNAGTYDPIGRRYYLGVRAKF